VVGAAPPAVGPAATVVHETHHYHEHDNDHGHSHADDKQSVNITIPFKPSKDKQGRDEIRVRTMKDDTDVF